MRQIVGIARTANYSAWGEPPQPCVYLPLEQNYSDAMILYVRSKGDPRQILLADRREIAIVIGTPPNKIPSKFPPVSISLPLSGHEGGTT